MNEKVFQFAKNNGYDDAKYLGKWDKFDVFSPYLKDVPDTVASGTPITILFNESTLRFSHSGLESLKSFYNSHY